MKFIRQAVKLEPGDATRYDLDIITVRRYEVLVVLYRTRQRASGPSMWFTSQGDGPTYTPESVSKTMGVTLAEAGVILAYLRDHHGIPALLGIDFNQDTGVWVGHTFH